MDVRRRTAIDQTAAAGDGATCRARDERGRNDRSVLRADQVDHAIVHRPGGVALDLGGELASANALYFARPVGGGLLP